MSKNGRGTSFQDLKDQLSEKQGKGTNGHNSNGEYNHDHEANSQLNNHANPGLSRKDLVSLEAPIHSVVGAETQLGSQFHSETKVRHIINHDRTPGILLSLMLRGEEGLDTSESDMLKRIDDLQTLKTGAVSVSDPFLRSTESPLGDATMLPVLALEDLKDLNLPVPNWVGMNSTHTGFQVLQEAYQEGKCFGGKPQFKLPKIYRKAGLKRMPTQLSCWHCFGFLLLYLTVNA
jgi:hypothetical protein